MNSKEFTTKRFKPKKMVSNREETIWKLRPLKKQLRPKKELSKIDRENVKDLKISSTRTITP